MTNTNRIRSQLLHGVIVIDKNSLPVTHEARLRLVQFWNRDDRREGWPITRDMIEKARRLDVLQTAQPKAWDALQGITELMGAVGMAPAEKKIAARAEVKLAAEAAKPAVEAALTARYALREYDHVRVPCPEYCVYWHAEQRRHPALFDAGLPHGLDTVPLTAVTILGEFADVLANQTRHGDWLSDDWQQINISIDRTERSLTR
jgi:hypothetical protein